MFAFRGWLLEELHCTHLSLKNCFEKKTEKCSPVNRQTHALYILCRHTKLKVAIFSLCTFPTIFG